MKIITISPTVSGWATVVYEDGSAKKMRSADLEAARQALANQEVTAPPEGADSVRARKIGNRRADVSKYERINGSLDCADPVAVALRGVSLDEIYEQASLASGYSVEDLQTKYAHLNPGMVRMCLGNIIRRNK